MAHPQSKNFNNLAVFSTQFSTWPSLSPKISIIFPHSNTFSLKNTNNLVNFFKHFPTHPPQNFKVVPSPQEIQEIHRFYIEKFLFKKKKNYSPKDKIYQT